LTVFLIQFINLLGTILYVAMLARVIMSWINVSPTNPFYVVIMQITEPIVAPIRRVLPRVGMLDFSPMVAIILIGLIQRVLIMALA
jgi:YggT family protein